MNDLDQEISIAQAELTRSYAVYSAALQKMDDLMRLKLEMTDKTFSSPDDAAEFICQEFHSCGLIQKIKLLRSIFPMGLREAKEAIDNEMGIIAAVSKGTW